jgi:hypothetical protein
MLFQLVSTPLKPLVLVPISRCPGLQLLHPFTDRMVGAIQAQDNETRTMDEQSSEIHVAAFY